MSHDESTALLDPDTMDILMQHPGAQPMPLSPNAQDYLKKIRKFSIHALEPIGNEECGFLASNINIVIGTLGVLATGFAAIFTGLQANTTKRCREGAQYTENKCNPSFYTTPLAMKTCCDLAFGDQDELINDRNNWLYGLVAVVAVTGSTALLLKLRKCISNRRANQPATQAPQRNLLAQSIRNDDAIKAGEKTHLRKLALAGDHLTADEADIITANLHP